MCKVSVVIPCYNVDSKLLQRCLASIDAQSFSDYEVIVVDDGSSPSYREIFNHLEKKYRNVTIYHQENRGVSAARNLGVKKSCGDFVVFIDADDYVSSMFLEEAVKTSLIYNADIVIGMNMTTYTTDTTELMGISDKNHPKINIFKLAEIKSIKKRMLGRVDYQPDGSYLGQGPWNRLINRRLAEDTPFDETLPIGEDIVWNLQLLQKAKKVCIVYKVWYIYYVNPNSSSRKYRDNAIKESYDSLMKIGSCLDFNDDEQYLSYCLRCWGDLKRIYRCYLSQLQKAEVDQMNCLFFSYPWNELASTRFNKICGLKYRFMRFLYINRLLFKYYYIKENINSLARCLRYKFVYKNYVNKEDNVERKF